MFSPEESRYLESQMLGRIATASPDDLQPDVAPVGFDFDGRYPYIGGMNMPKTLKYKNATRNRKVSFVVDDLVSTDPFVARGIKVWGTADIVDHEGYMGPGQYIRIEPTNKRAWGIEDGG